MTMTENKVCPNCHYNNENQKPIHDIHGNFLVLCTHCISYFVISPVERNEFGVYTNVCCGKEYIYIKQDRCHYEILMHQYKEIEVKLHGVSKDTPEEIETLKFEYINGSFFIDGKQHYCYARIVEGPRS